ncbi:MAG: endonuclease [Pyrinomonadaceae bacterium]|nr:endonuclease [Pyrinomonadaceae bacterium]
MDILKFFTRVVVYLFSIICVLLTLLPLLKFSHWTIRIGDFPRVQIGVLCLILSLILAALRTFQITDLILVAALLCSALYQFYRIYPYTFIAAREVEASKTNDTSSNIKLLIANVLIENRDSEKLLSLIEEYDPDVILLAEVDGWWIEATKQLEERYPFTVLHPLDNAYGIAFFSKLELVSPRLRFLVEKDVPSVETEIKLRNGKIINFYGLHPRPPIPGEKLSSETRDAELLIAAKEIQGSDQPTIVAGDFNDVAWSETTRLFQRISGLLDARIGRGFYNTFHADHFFLRFPLDHVFQSNHFRLDEIQRLGSINSDHFPIFVSLTLESTADITQDEPESNEAEEKEANQKIEEVKE